MLPRLVLNQIRKFHQIAETLNSSNSSSLQTVLRLHFNLPIFTSSTNNLEYPVYMYKGEYNNIGNSAYEILKQWLINTINDLFFFIYVYLVKSRHRFFVIRMCTTCSLYYALCNNYMQVKLKFGQNYFAPWNEVLEIFYIILLFMSFQLQDLYNKNVRLQLHHFHKPVVVCISVVGPWIRYFDNL